MPYYFMCFPDGKRKAVTLSYDDGSCHDEKLLEIINRHGLKCTFNLCSSLIGQKGRLSVEQIQQLIKDGHEAATHTATHLANGLTSPTDGIREVLTCREEMEKMLGRIVRGMAYPDCGITRFSDNNSYENVKSYLKNLGIVYSRTLGNDNDSFMLPTDWYAWMPSVHHANPGLFKYIDKFLSIDVDNMYCAYRYPRLFYMWGHAHEFHYGKNWDILEKAGEVLGGKDDIWYATNIEIYDYTAAYNSLVWSADRAIVYNPSLFTLWFASDEHKYTIKPGQTLKI